MAPIGGVAVAGSGCRRPRRPRAKRSRTSALRNNSSVLLAIDDGGHQQSRSEDVAVVVDAATNATPSRRSALLAAGAALLSASSYSSASAAAATTDGAPLVGDCADCVGVVNDLLNSCPEETEVGEEGTGDGMGEGLHCKLIHAFIVIHASHRTYESLACCMS